MEREHNYTIGTRVRVKDFSWWKSLLKEQKDDKADQDIEIRLPDGDNIMFVESMTQYLNQKATICGLGRNGRYFLHFDGKPERSNYYWVEEMFYSIEDEEETINIFREKKHVSYSWHGCSTEGSFQTIWDVIEYCIKADGNLRYQILRAISVRLNTTPGEMIKERLSAENMYSMLVSNNMEGLLKSMKSVVTGIIKEYVQDHVENQSVGVYVINDMCMNPVLNIYEVRNTNDMFQEWCKETLGEGNFALWDCDAKSWVVAPPKKTDE